jgi:low temperature requirement protein LtrA
MQRLLAGVGLYLLVDLTLAAVFLPTLCAIRRIWLGQRYGTRVVLRRSRPASRNELAHFGTVVTVNLLALPVSGATPCPTVVLAVAWGAALLLAITIPQWRCPQRERPFLSLIGGGDNGR